MASKEQMQAEIDRLQELLRGTGANRYWEARWRDEKAENERLKELLRRWHRIADRFKDHVGLDLTAHPVHDDTVEALQSSNVNMMEPKETSASG